MKHWLSLLLFASMSVLASDSDRWDMPHAANPLLPGYYADPTVLTEGGTFYIYVTLDPWGGVSLGCWESGDFKQWTFRELNWPTKQACTSPTSKGANVWAPSVVKGRDGRFHMFISVGSEIWTGVADHPLGPWRNALVDQPLVSANYNRTYHMIDADAFIDEDGGAYLYWGSGLNWVNGACFAAKLNSDLSGFVGEVKIITPSNYFEGPTMLKQDDRYYLTYSDGKTVSDTYKVRYAVSDHPLGPFVEAANSPILITDHARNVVSPGHHGFFRQGSQVYIVYHRHRVPFVEDTAFRQICMDALHFTGDGLIEKIVPTHRGPTILLGRSADRHNLADPAGGAQVTASSSATEFTLPNRVLDDNYATRWAAAPEAEGGWVQLDLGTERRISSSEIRFEYAWKPQRFGLETSRDGQTWRTVADYRSKPIARSPVMIHHDETARYLRLVFPNTVQGRDIGLWEWAVF